MATDLHRVLDDRFPILKYEAQMAVCFCKSKAHRANTSANVNYDRTRGKRLPFEP